MSLFSELQTGLDIAMGEPGFVDHPAAIHFELIEGTEEDAESIFTFPANEITLTLNPTDLKMGSVAAQSIIFTQGGVWIEESGAPLETIEISGTTGISRKATFSLTSFPFPMSGYQEFHTLKMLFNDYWERKSKYENCVMVFRNFKDEDHFFVVPVAFNEDRSSSSPHTYRYSIQMTAYKRLSSLFDPITKSILAGFLNDPLGYISEMVTLSLLAVTDTLAMVWDNTLETITSFERYADNAEDYWSSFAERVAEPYINAYDEAVRELNDTNEIKDKLEDVDEGDALAAAELGEPAKHKNFSACMNLGKVAHNLELILINPSYFQKPFDKNFETITKNIKNETKLDKDINALNPNLKATGLKAQATTAADNLQDNASRNYGDSSRWKEIAVTNDLKAPYEDFAGNKTAPGIMGSNDSLIIPTKTVNQFKNQYIVGKKSGLGRDYKIGYQPEYRKSPEEAALGTDIRLTGDWDYAINSAKSDIVTVSGVDNLKQALLIKVLTELHSNVLYPRIGYMNVLGSKITINNMLKAKNLMERALLADDRIVAVDRVLIGRKDTMITLTATISVKGIEEKKLIVERGL